MSEGDEQTRSEVDDGAEGAEAGTFAGLADLDEDLRTMSQSNAEVERWRRLSTRGLTPATGTTREGGGLDAPIIDQSVSTSEMDAHEASTSPGTIESPTQHALVRPASARPEPITMELPIVPAADSTRKLSAITPQGLEAIDVESATPGNARRSFAPPKDTPSAPPGSRVVLPARSSHPPGRISSRPVKVPRPSQPPPDADEAVVRGWRASDPSAAPEEDGVDGFVIPGPAPLPGSHRAARTAQGSTPPAPLAGRPSAAGFSSAVAAQGSTPPPAEAERPTLESTLEVSGTVIALALGVALALFFALIYVFFL
jgi:hypothetical protein